MEAFFSAIENNWGTMFVLWIMAAGLITINRILS